MSEVAASHLVAALARRHSEDVFVPECKDGPSQTRSHRRLDAWALVKTWSPITTIGYEVKVSRSDWRRDEKIADYFPLCHLLNVVAPKGIVPIEELPAGVGLLELAGTGDGARLVTKRKAARREIELPSELMVYVLMCRAQITRERVANDSSWRVDTLRKWAEGKDDRQKLSYAVSRKIRAAFDEQEHRLTELNNRVRQLEEIQERIVELGFSPCESVSAWRVSDRLRELSGIATPALVRALKEAASHLSIAQAAIERLAAKEVA